MGNDESTSLDKSVNRYFAETSSKYITFIPQPYENEPVKTLLGSYYSDLSAQNIDLSRND